MVEKEIQSRIIHKHETEADWLKATNFIPKQAELIIYDIEIDGDGNTLPLPEGRDIPYTYERFKIGDGIHTVSMLPFVDEGMNISSVNVYHEGFKTSDIIDTYILSIDYNALAFDTTEIIAALNKSSILGQAILGQMILT